MNMLQIDPQLIQAKLAQNKNSFIALGIIFLVLGIVALYFQFAATIFVTYLIGALLIIAGVVQGIYSFQIKGFGYSALLAVLAVVYVVAGFFTFRYPISATREITLIIGFMLLISGVIQFVQGLSNQSFPRWGWVVFSGIISFILGLMIYFNWPADSVYMLGLFLGIDLIFQGWNLIFLSLAVKDK